MTITVPVHLADDAPATAAHQRDIDHGRLTRAVAAGPVYALQLATSYISLAVPATAARVAINIRFFQRHGLPAGSALAVRALDGVAQFVVEALLLVGTLLVG